MQKFVSKVKKGLKKKGFTILELIIVIAVIGTLMTIMFAGGSALINNSKKTSVKNDFRSMIQMAESAYTENPTYSEGVTVAQLNDGCFTEKLKLDEATTLIAGTTTAKTDAYGTKYAVKEITLETASVTGAKKAVVFTSAGPDKAMLTADDMIAVVTVNPASPASGSAVDAQTLNAGVKNYAKYTLATDATETSGYKLTVTA